MVARTRLLGPPKGPPLYRLSNGWPTSRLHGTSPIRLLAGTTLLVVAVALGTGHAGATESAAPHETTIVAASPSL